MTIHNLGFPRIGGDRELKKALESYWNGEATRDELLSTGRRLRNTHWQFQKALDLVPVGDFSLYDQVLDMSFLLGNVPERASKTGGNLLDRYFRLARGRSAGDRDSEAIRAGEMTKWFDTNYHYIVPEFSDSTEFSLHPENLLTQVDEARLAGVNAKPVLIGPITYLWLGKTRDSIDKKHLLKKLLPVYTELLRLLASRGVEWVQIDEPILATDLEPAWSTLFRQSYESLGESPVKVVLATYFGALGENLELALTLPVKTLHVDVIRGDWAEAEILAQRLPKERNLSLGVIDGRNIWKTDLNSLLTRLEPLSQLLADRLWLAPSCSLLHVPVDLSRETVLDSELVSWMAFARQKLEELDVLARALSLGRDTVSRELDENNGILENRRTSIRTHNPAVRERLEDIDPDWSRRKKTYAERAELQRGVLDLPLYPTTTIGSFPQTGEIRRIRRQFRRKDIDIAEYQTEMRKVIRQVVKFQEEIGLDVLVHGEAERNDMVEYFGEMLDGFAFTRFGWVQSYGSRCVKPPILYGDVHRPKPMTVEWITYAQSLTEKPMKGMLTGPVTLLNWSFVRNDQPREVTCRQLALAVRDEVLDLEKAGIRVIQIDEAALREGLPTKRGQWQEYLDWAIEAFRLAANGVGDSTQIHTHMCYSEFNDIMGAVIHMDADVITIEAARSDMEILDAFDKFAYPNEVGPGVYDIHSPNIPSVDFIVNLINDTTKKIPKERVWINPDCGLKTRAWAETEPSLKNMVEAARRLRRAENP